MDNINDIISSLSPQDIDMLKDVASSIIGRSDSEQSSAPTTAVANNGLGSLGLSADDFNMIMKAKSIFDNMNSASSKNADLINALKPHLSEKSQQKADQAMKILRLFEILPYLKDLF
ncbi:MAG: hypothetical protein PUE73_06065 [Eubacteriales bacterium]|nr:hypothetical protein [Eubacteriales bacterium]